MYPVMAAWVEKSKGRRQYTMSEREYRDISFNPELLKINHYQYYPQMIPFVGKNYKETRLLVIAESHYLPPKTEDFDPEKLSNAWYEYGKNPIPKTAENALYWVDYTWTAKIVAADRWNNKGHKIFKILQKSLKSERLMNCAFMNFFQRPVPKEGASMKDFITPYDIEVAGDTLQAVCKILEPTKIFFVSIMAYNAFYAYINNKEHPLKWEWAKNSCQAIQMKDCFNNAIVGHGSHTADWRFKRLCDYTRPMNRPSATGKEAFEYFISDEFKF